MMRESSPCGICGNRGRCRVFNIGCGLPKGDGFRICVEEFCMDAEIPIAESCMFAVKSGAVKRICHDASGQSRIVDFSFPGDWIGLEALAEADDSGLSYRASVSMTSVCRVSINSDVVKRVSQAFCKCLSAELATRMRASFHYRQIVAESSQARVAHYLVRLYRSVGAAGAQAAILPHIARTDIASYLHLRVETVSRVLSAFRRKGWVRGPLHRLQVADLDALDALVQLAQQPGTEHRPHAVQRLQESHE